jgi:integrase
MAGSPGGKRRGRGQGNIEPLPSGRFRAVLSAGKDDQGRRRKVAATFDTRQQALRWLRERLKARDPGRLSRDRKTTPGESIDRWLASRKNDVGTTTRRDPYDHYILLHLTVFRAPVPQMSHLKTRPRK